MGLETRQKITIENGSATVAANGSVDVYNLSQEDQAASFRDHTDFASTGLISLMQLRRSDPEHPVHAVLQAALLEESKNGLDHQMVPSILIRALADYEGKLEFTL